MNSKLFSPLFILSIVLLFYFLTIFLGACFYGFFMGISFDDALFMSFSVVTTLGYDGESDWLRLVAAFQVFFGLTLIGVALHYLVKFHDERIIDKLREVEAIRKRERLIAYLRNVKLLYNDLNESIDLMFRFEGGLPEKYDNEKGVKALIYSLQYGSNLNSDEKKIYRYWVDREAFLKSVEVMVYRFDVDEVINFSNFFFGHLLRSTKSSELIALSGISSIERRTLDGIKKLVEDKSDDEILMNNSAGFKNILELYNELSGQKRFLKSFEKEILNVFL